MDNPNLSNFSAPPFSPVINTADPSIVQASQTTGNGPTTNKSRINIDDTNRDIILMTAVLSLVVFFGVALFGYFFYIKPRIEAVKFSRKLLVISPDLHHNIEDVGNDLNKITDIITNKTTDTEAPKKLLRADVNVGGASSRATGSYGFLYEAITDFKQVSDRLKNPKTNVLGETALEPKSVTTSRILKGAADKTVETTKKAQLKLEELKAYLTDNKSLTSIADLKIIFTDYERSNRLADDYLDQARKVAGYYSRVTDIEIELVPLLSSYSSLVQGVSQTVAPNLYLSRLDELESTLTNLTNRINAINKDDLPVGIGELHQDNLKVFNILTNNMSQVKTSIKAGGLASFVKSFVVLSQDLEPIVTRSTTREISFWQNSGLVGKHQAVLADYSEDDRQAEKFIQTNKLPLISP